MSRNRDSSRTLRSRRAVRTDAALGDDSAAAPSRLRASALLAKAGRNTFPLAAPTWPGSVPRPAPDPVLGVHYDTFPPITIDHEAARESFQKEGKTLHLMQPGEAREI